MVKKNPVITGSPVIRKKRFFGTVESFYQDANFLTSYKKQCGQKFELIRFLVKALYCNFPWLIFGQIF